jgi:hypothetical protein
VSGHHLEVYGICPDCQVKLGMKPAKQHTKWTIICIEKVKLFQFMRFSGLTWLPHFLILQEKLWVSGYFSFVTSILRPWIMQIFWEKCLRADEVTGIILLLSKTELSF